jgi:hypothetical protein
LQVGEAFVLVDALTSRSRAQGLVDVERPAVPWAGSPAGGPPEATRWVKTALYADGTVGSL